MKRKARSAASVLWPAFLCAAALEVVVFTFVDPADLQQLNGAALGLSATAAYSLAFFAFWLICAASGALTLLLHGSADDIVSQFTMPGR